MLFLAKIKGYVKPMCERNECLTPIINNANQLLILIQKAPGLTTLELAERSCLSFNVCFVYLKELLALKLILRNRFTQEPTWSFRETKEQEINALEQEVSLEFIK